jgi:hypothetical protein
VLARRARRPSLALANAPTSAIRSSTGETHAAATTGVALPTDLWERAQAEREVGDAQRRRQDIVVIMV